MCIYIEQYWHFDHVFFAKGTYIWSILFSFYYNHQRAGNNAIYLYSDQDKSPPINSNTKKIGRWVTMTLWVDTWCLCMVKECIMDYVLLLFVMMLTSTQCGFGDVLYTCIYALCNCVLNWMMLNNALSIPILNWLHTFLYIEIISINIHQFRRGGQLIPLLFLPFQRVHKIVPRLFSENVWRMGRWIYIFVYM